MHLQKRVSQIFKFVVRTGKPALYIKGAFRLTLPHIFEKLGCSLYKVSGGHCPPSYKIQAMVMNKKQGVAQYREG